MIDELKMMRFIRGPRQEVFNYFIDPKLLESWAYPNGMSLRVPIFEPRIGGQYRFEHTNEEGTYVCTGRVKDFAPGSKLVQVDHVVDPQGKPLYPKIETVTTFSNRPDGTLVTITQRGFADEDSIRSCEMGWNECLDRLDSLFSGQLELR